MTTFTVDTPFQEIYDLPEVKPLIPYFIGKRAPIIGLSGDTTLRKRNLPDPNRDIYAQCDGVNYLLKKLAQGEKILYDVYSEDEIVADPEKAAVKLLYFRTDADKARGSKKNKPFVVLCPGGGYSSVCSVIEGFHTAQELNVLGYPVFILNYRVGYENLMPDPIDDLATALRYILRHTEELGVAKEKYVVGGFSAGGHLAAEWGSDNYGYATYGLPKPTALFLVYSVISRQLKPGREEALDRIYGGHTQDLMDKYDVYKHLWKGYPASFLVHCKDDAEVSPRNSIMMRDGLSELKIPNELLLGEYGGHGFGSGRSTDVEGWTKKAVAFLENQIKENTVET